MLKARDFLEMDLQHSDEEVSRLESLYAQIERQSLEEKQRLTAEFMAIVENPCEQPDKRIFACNLLGARRKELDLVGSKSVARRLQKILEREFTISKRIGFLQSREVSLRKMGTLQFCLFEILVIALLRIDFENTHRLVQRIASMIKDAKFKKHMEEALVAEVERLDPTRPP